ncbi:uncharacterized protein LOC126714030 [Quercus robur]|uniref:uncharacterized protein LOC126714030 n=1 Tax=Quercus robur TaxID=38942 RepID=UPI0021634255|nr:uncharacterized protein LOC126714030 [Quercus robur]
MLTAPDSGEDLFMYLSVSDHTVSAVLLKDRGVQQPMYYISKTLVDAETRYLPLEKLVLALVHATRKLPHYFQAYTVFVLTEYPLQSLLKRLDFTDRIAKWGTQLEFSPKNDRKIICNVENRPWKVFVDGASSAMGAGAGIVIITPEGIRLEHSFRLGFKASNNEAEYESFLTGLRTVLCLGARDVEVYSDSRLVVYQIQGSFKAWDSRMKAYLSAAKKIISKFGTVKVAQVGRAQNKHVDSLATLASSITEEVPWLIKVKLIRVPSIGMEDNCNSAGVDVIVISTTRPCWMNPIIDFLAKDKVPDDEKEAKKIRRVASQYWPSADCKLYRMSFGGPYLLCLHPEKVNELLSELHDEVCSGHVGGRSLAHRAMTQGFWWPQMQKDAAEYVRKCEQCQKHAPLIHKPTSRLSPVNSPWPFAQ